MILALPVVTACAPASDSDAPPAGSTDGTGRAEIHSRTIDCDAEPDFGGVLDVGSEVAIVQVEVCGEAGTRCRPGDPFRTSPADSTEWAVGTCGEGGLLVVTWLTAGE